MPIPALLLALLVAAPPGAGAAAAAPEVAAGGDSTIAPAWTVAESDSISTGLDAGAFDWSGIAVDAFGRLFASDANGHRLARLDARGGWLGAEGALGSGSGEFRRPGAVAIHGTLEVAVLDRENRRVTRYDFLGRSRGTLIDLAAAEIESRLGRVDPADLACDRGGAMAIADRDAERVLMFGVGGEFLRALGGYGAGAGSLHGLAGVAFEAQGDLLVTERAAGRIQRLDAGGRSLASWPLRCDAAAGALPVAARGDGAIAVADESGGTLRVFDRDGRLRASRGDLRMPRSLAFAPDGALFVAEGGGGRIRRFIVAAAVSDSVRTE